MDLLDLITGVSINSKGIYQFNDEYNMKIYAKQGNNATLNSKVLIKRREDSKYDISYIQDSPTIPLSSRDDIQVTLIPDTEGNIIDIKTNPVLYTRKSTVLFSSGSEIILDSYLGHVYLELRNSDIKSSSIVNSAIINNMKHLVRIDDEENASFSILDDKTDLELHVIEKINGKLNIEVIGIVDESILNSSVSINIDGSLYKCNISDDLRLEKLGNDPSTDIYSLEKVEAKYGIFCNGKKVTPKLNGKNLSRVMYNGKKIWPNLLGIKELWIDTKLCEGQVTEDSAEVFCNPFLGDLNKETIDVVLKTPYDLYKLNQSESFNIIIDGSGKDISSVKNVNINVEPNIDISCFGAVIIKSDIENISLSLNISGDSSYPLFMRLDENDGSIRSKIDLSKVNDFSFFYSIFDLTCKNRDIIINEASPKQDILKIMEGANNNTISINKIFAKNNGTQFTINGGGNNTISINSIDLSDSDKRLKNDFVIVNGGANNIIEFSESSFDNINFNQDYCLVNVRGGGTPSLQIKGTKNVIKKICDKSLYCPIRFDSSVVQGLDNPFIISDDSKDDKIIDLYIRLISIDGSRQIRCYPIFSNNYNNRNLKYEISIDGVHYPDTYPKPEINLVNDSELLTSNHAFGTGFNIVESSIIYKPSTVIIYILDENNQQIFEKTIDIDYDNPDYCIENI